VSVYSHAVALMLAVCNGAHFVVFVCGQMATRNTLCMALKTASLHGQVDVVRVLLDAGADVSARDENGDSQAHFAAFE